MTDTDRIAADWRESIKIDGYYMSTRDNTLAILDERDRNKKLIAELQNALRDELRAAQDKKPGGLIDTKRPVQTVDGFEAEIVHDNMGGDYPLLAVVTLRSGLKYSAAYALDGQRSDCNPGDSCNLINVPEPLTEDKPVEKKPVKTVWVNKYRDGYGGDHDSREEADDHATNWRVGIERLDIFDDGSRTYTPEPLEEGTK